MKIAIAFITFLVILSLAGLYIVNHEISPADVNDREIQIKIGYYYITDELKLRFNGEQKIGRLKKNLENVIRKHNRYDLLPVEVEIGLKKSFYISVNIMNYHGNDVKYYEDCRSWGMDLSIIRELMNASFKYVNDVYTNWYGSDWYGNKSFDMKTLVTLNRNGDKLVFGASSWYKKHNEADYTAVIDNTIFIYSSKLNDCFIGFGNHDGCDRNIFSIPTPDFTANDKNITNFVYEFFQIEQ